MNAHYEVLSRIQASVGEGRQAVGTAGRCRYCGCADPSIFRKTAHTFPEALGNKWVVSVDECDACNAMFSKYEDALAKAVGSFLTLGGVQGKSGVRQTGRSQGSLNIRHSRVDGKRKISVTSDSGGLGFDSKTGNLVLTIPVPKEKFIPILAYKALCKMGLALLPDEEIKHFQKLMSWIQDVTAAACAAPLEVGASFGSVGNAPPIVTGTLLRRRCTEDASPYMIFLFCTGSVCLQIQLRSDVLDDHVPSPVALSVRWSIKLATPEGSWLGIDYGKSVQLDWSGDQMVLQPIESFVLDFDPQTKRATLTPVVRKQD